MMWILQCKQCHKSFTADVHGRRMIRKIEYRGYDKEAVINAKAINHLSKADAEMNKPITIDEPIWILNGAPGRCDDCRSGKKGGPRI